MVQPDAPAAVVEEGDCLKVFSDPFEVASFLMDCRVGVPIEGKRKHLLAKTTLPRVSGAGRRVKRLWDSEENIKRQSYTDCQRINYLHEVGRILLGHPHCLSSNMNSLLEQLSPPTL